MEERYFTAKEILTAKFENVQYGGEVPLYPSVDGLEDSDVCLLAFCDKGSAWVIEEGGVAYSFATEEQIKSIPEYFREYKEKLLDPVLEAIRDNKHLFITSDIPRDFDGYSYKSLWDLMSDEFSGGLYAFLDTLRFVKEIKEVQYLPQIIIFPELYMYKNVNRCFSFTEMEQRLNTQKFIRELKDEDRFIMYSNSSIIFNELRCEVKKGELEAEDIGFLHVHWNGGLELQYPNIDRNGRFDYWPNGFFDTYGKQLDDIL